MKKKKNNRKRKQKRKQSPYQRGLKIGCINTRGLVAHPTKRIDLNNWMQLHNIDVVCIQEWYVPKKKNVNNNNNTNRKENEQNDSNDENDYGLAPQTVSLNMSAFTNYSKVEHDSKTLILYKSSLNVTRFDHFEKISTTGLDISWIAVETNRKIIVIGSIYHSPSHTCEYDQII